MITTYDHHRHGILQALPAPDGFAPAAADWIVVREGSEKLYGYIVDDRGDNGSPSPVAPEDDDAKPYEAYDSRGKYITCTHSLRGALLAVGNRA